MELTNVASTSGAFFFLIHKFGPLILGTRAYSIVFIKTLKKFGQHKITFHFNFSEGDGGGGEAASCLMIYNCVFTSVDIYGMIDYL